MKRFEITGTATDVFSLADIQSALRKSGAINVRARNAFGQSNQPKVATFSAETQNYADKIASDARELLPLDGFLPALLAWEY